jgi:hypothetical protein
MPSLAQILAPNEREYFALFERAGANLVRAAGLLEEMLAGYPDQRELAGAFAPVASAGVPHHTTEVSNEIVPLLFPVDPLGTPTT